MSVMSGSLGISMGGANGSPSLGEGIRAAWVTHQDLVWLGKDPVTVEAIRESGQSMGKR